MKTQSVASALTTEERTIAVLMPAQTPFSGVALAAGEFLSVADRVQVTDPTGAYAPVSNAGSGDTRLGVEGRSGSIWSTGRVQLSDRLRVEGDVLSSAGVTTGNSVVVTGTVDPRTVLTPLSRTEWRTRMATTPLSDVHVEPGLTQTLAPGFYGNTYVKSGSSLVLGGGNYGFYALTLEPLSKLVVNDEIAPVVVTIRDGLTFRGAIESTRGGLPDLVLQVLSRQWLSIEAPFRGSIIAPDGFLRLGGTSQTTHEGAFYARGIEVLPDVRINHRGLSLDSMQPPGPRGLQPIGECVRNVDGQRYVAVFGYRNLTNGPVTLERGTENQLFGADADELPAAFLAGGQRNAVTVAFSGESVSWVLDGRTATLSKRSNPCAPLAFEPIRDTGVVQSEPNRSFGSENTLALGSGKLAFIGFGIDAIKRSLGAGQYVSRATLELPISSGSPQSLQVFSVNKPWTERGTWNCADDANPLNGLLDCASKARWTLGQPGRPPYNPWDEREPGAELPVMIEGGRVLVDVTSDLTSALYPGSDQYGWVLRLPSTAATLFSRESGHGPRLILETIPLDPADPAFEARLEVVVDASVVPTSPTVPGLDLGLPPRPVGVVVDPDGQRSELVADELVLETADPAVLSSFLSRWNGTVVGSYPISGEEPLTSYVVVIDPALAHVDALEAYLSRIDNRPRGVHLVSSDHVAGLLAAAAESTLDGLLVDVDWIGVDDAPFGPFVSRSILEGGDASGRNVGSNPFLWPPMAIGTVLDTGVAGAWRLLFMAGKLNQVIKVGVSDTSFSPMGNYPSFTEHHVLSGAPTLYYNGPPWHGTHVVQTGFGDVNDGIGSAGPGGPVSLVHTVNRESRKFTAKRSVDFLRELGVDIISMSFHFDAPAAASAFAQGFRRATRRAHEAGILVFASAGNDNKDIDDRKCIVACWEKLFRYPCECEHVTCVGGLAYDSGEKHPDSAYGDKDVDAWAPYEPFSGPNPDVPGDTTFAVRTGTSFATPFTAGIAALAWAANPSASASTVLDTLYATSQAGSTPHVRRWFRALPAVNQTLADLGNAELPAEISILTPSPGASFSYSTPIQFIGSPFFLAVDEAGNVTEQGSTSVTWTLEGPIGGDTVISDIIAQGPMSGTLTVPQNGTWLLRAEFTTPDGRTRSSDVSFTVGNQLPVIEITDPVPDGAGLTVWYPGPTAIRVHAWDAEDGDLCQSLQWNVFGGSIVQDGISSGYCDRQLLLVDRLDAHLQLSVTDSQNATTTLEQDLSFWLSSSDMNPVLDIMSPVEGTGFYAGATVVMHGMMEAIATGTDYQGWAWIMRSPYRTTTVRSRPGGPGEQFDWYPFEALGPNPPEFENGVVPVELTFRGWDTGGRSTTKSIVVYFLEEGSLLPTCGALTCADNSDCGIVCTSGSGICEIPQARTQGCCSCSPA